MKLSQATIHAMWLDTEQTNALTTGDGDKMFLNTLVSLLFNLLTCLGTWESLIADRDVL